MRTSHAPPPDGTPEPERIGPPLRVAVVIPSWRRPDSLRACLAGLALLHRDPDDIIVVHRPDDEETAAAALAGGARTVVVHEPGVVAALRTGAAAAGGDVVAFLDDDAVPRPGWLDHLLAPYADPRVGAVGGRDVVHGPDGVLEGEEARVGIITRYGRVFGSHHLGTGPRRHVHILKGTNMSVRRRLLRFPDGLRGEADQCHHEIATCLHVLAKGGYVVYDPRAVVDHRPAERLASEGRRAPPAETARHHAYNLLASLLAVRPSLGLRRAVYGVAVGDAGSPGLIRAGLAVLRGEPEVAGRLVPSWRGQFEALGDFLGGRRIRLVP